MDTAKKPAFELTLERLIAAPRERVWKAWARPEEIVLWFAPRPYTLSVDSMDLRTGGSFRMAMRAPDGTEHAFGGVYREVVLNERIVWTGPLADGPADQVHTEVIFKTEGAKTKVSAHQSFSVLTPSTEPMVKGARAGWTMTLEQLAAHCERKKEDVL
jgi:uncharacterized protein YndB with AHSA1/START domain